MRHLNLPGMAQEVFALLNEIDILCPEHLPDPDTVLTDEVILTLFVQAIKASGFETVLARLGHFTAFMFLEEQFGLIDLVSKGIENAAAEDLLQEVRQMMDYAGISLLSGIEVFGGAYTYDDFYNDINSNWIPFSLSLYAAEHFTDSEGVSQIYNCHFGIQDAGAGVLTAAASPFLGLLANQIEGWESPQAALAGLDRFPLMAFFLDDFSLPGIRDPVIAGKMMRSDHQGSTWLAWSQLTGLLDEIEIIAAASKVASNHLPMSPVWLAAQILNTFQPQGGEDGRG